MFGKKRNKKTDAEYAQMQQAGATGNSPVETRKGGTEGQEPLRSSNELNIPKITPTITTENSGVNKATTVMNNVSNEHYKEQLYKNQVALNEQYESLKDKLPKNEDNGYLTFEGKDFNEKAAEERLNNSETFKSILQRAQEENDEYKTKSEKASKQAQMAAWGNLVSAIGQLAGVGKNTYVKPENKYLTDALAKSDKAREVYDAIKAKNRDYETKYRAAFMDNERKAHAEAEKLRKGAIDDYNNLLQKDKVENNKHNLNIAKYQLDLMYKNGQLSNQQYANETARLKLLYDREKDANKAPFLKQTVNGIVFSGDKADAGEMAEIIRRTGWQNKGALSGVDATALQLVLSGNVENVDPVSFNRVVNNFLRDPENLKRAEVKNFLNRMKASKASNNEVFSENLVEW